MGLRRLPPLHRGLLALVVSLTACSAPQSSEGSDELGSVELAATSPELRASKWMKLGSNLPESRSSQADFRACEGQSFWFTVAFRNMGSAIWRDVPGRGDEVGSDVFFETANGKKDVLSGKKRFSLRFNGNDYVRGDRKAKECTMKPGCRRTKAIYGGIPATAPSKPGIYKSRWRLRDYSKAWDKPTGFGPKAQVRVLVEDCRPPGSCPCEVLCYQSNGTVTVRYANSAEECGAVAGDYCPPGEVASFHFIPCNDAPDGGTGGSGSGGVGGVGGGSPGSGGSGPDPNVEEPPDGPGPWTYSSGGTGGAGGGSSGAGGWPSDDPGIGTDEPDDPDYEPDGFDGVAEDIPAGVTAAEESGCSLTVERRPSGALGLGLLLALGALSRRRQKASRSED